MLPLCFTYFINRVQYIPHSYMKKFLKLTLASCLGFTLSSLLFIGMFILVLVFGMGGISSSKKIEIVEHTVLHIELEGTLSEQTRETPFYDSWSNDGKITGLHELIETINTAKEDDNIAGIWLDMGFISAGNASIAELRKTLENFKKSEKFIVAYGENYSQQMYYLATVADKIFVHPSGSIELKGLASQPVFLKNTLSKLGINMQVVKIGDYKGAPEMYTRTTMSDENKLQTSSLLKQLWLTMRNTIADSRKISPTDVDMYAKKSSLFTPTQNYIAMNLADSLLYPDEMLNYFKTRIDSSFNEETQLTTAFDYKNSWTDKKENKEKIAIIYADGGIDDGSMEGIDSEKLAELLAESRKDENIKAVVLRINSPGGSAFGSEKIWRETSLYKGSKPLIVSMGDYAASGGYYIATAADSIFTQAETLTGSIGIFAIIPDFSQLSEKLGFNYDVQKTHDLADFPSLTRQLTQQERQVLEKYIHTGYQLFLKRCYEGRSMDEREIEKVASGRVWTGADAVSNGLADKIGGLQNAIESASLLAGVSTYDIIHLPKKKSMWEEILDESTIRMQSFFTPGMPINEYRFIRLFVKEKMNMVIQARMEQNLEVW